MTTNLSTLSKHELNQRIDQLLDKPYETGTGLPENLIEEAQAGKLTTADILAYGNQLIERAQSQRVRRTELEEVRGLMEELERR